MKINLERLRAALETRTALLASFVFMRVALELGYWVFVSKYFGYSGFVWQPDALKYIESWVLFLVLLTVVPYRIKRPSDYMVITLLAGVLLPVLSFYGLADQSRVHLYIMLLGYILVLFFRNGKPFTFPLVRRGLAMAVALSVIGATLVSLWLVGSGGIRYINFDLTQVYEFRRDSGALTGRFGFQYFNVWAYKVFGPLLLAVGLWKRWWPLVAIVLALHVFWFGVSAHKSVLFYPLVVVAVWLWVRKLPATALIPIGMAAVILSALASYLIWQDLLWASMFIRRVFYVIANNSFSYYEFFSENPKVWWSNSVLSWINEYPYVLNPALLIGDWRGAESWVNNSFLSTGYMHAGIMGVVFYGVLVGLLFRFVDSFAYAGVPVWLSVAVLVIPMRSLLISSDFFTAMLTHGVGLAALLLFLMRSRTFQLETERQDSRPRSPLPSRIPGVR